MNASKNNRARWLFISLVIVSISLLPITCSGETLLSGPAINQRGSFISPGAGYTALLDFRDGEILGLIIVSKSDGARSNVIYDVTGIFWIGEKKLLYSVSPIYGTPGICTFDCGQMKSKRIIGPKNFGKGYPDGVDYFELKDFSEGKIYFYYAPDARKANLDAIETKEYLYQINLDGTGFKKVEAK